MVGASHDSTDPPSDDDCFELIGNENSIGKKDIDDEEKVDAVRQNEVRTVARDHYQRLEDEAGEWSSFTMAVIFYLAISNLCLATLIILFPTYKGWFVILLFLINLPIAAYSIAIKHHETIWNWIVAIPEWYYGKTPTPPGPLRTLWVRVIDGCYQYAEKEGGDDEYEYESNNDVEHRKMGSLSGTALSVVSEHCTVMRRGDRIVAFNDINIEGLSFEVICELTSRLGCGDTVTVRYDPDHLELEEKKFYRNENFKAIAYGTLIGVCMYIIYGIYSFHQRGLTMSAAWVHVGCNIWGDYCMSDSEMV